MKISNLRLATRDRISRGRLFRVELLLHFRSPSPPPPKGLNVSREKQDLRTRDDAGQCCFLFPSDLRFLGQKSDRGGTAIAVVLQGMLKLTI